jgi:N-dimethylarginine dimethylaminohydrolase
VSTHVYKTIADLKGFSLKSCGPMPEPGEVLMCSPDHFEIVDVKNPFMSGHVGTINRSLARRQWETVKNSFELAGKRVDVIEPLEGLEDMTFCANQTFVGLTPTMERICLLSQMRHPSRRREVPAFEAWFKKRGYKIAKLKDSSLHFEGAGDAIWHPGKRLLWGGHGFRSQPEAYEDVARLFQTPVVLLKLVNEKFYHLDTCFCPLTSESVLIYPSAFDADSLELILKIFPVVLTASENEASRHMACNAAVLDGKTAVVQKGAATVARHMAGMGLRVVEVDTSEFIKSGGSVYCLKMFVY